MEDRSYILSELESLYIEAKDSGMEEEQKAHLMIELLRQIEYIKDEGLVPSLNIREEYISIYNFIKDGNLDETISLQLRLEIMRFLSYK